MSKALTDVPISISTEDPAIKKSTWKRLVQSDPRVESNWDKPTKPKHSFNSLNVPNDLPYKRRLVSHQERGSL